ncbi:Indoleamine 2,3-dioxygenase [Dentipellis sp. KUC8613]|nr:Indoleamine 2,3-dioxygenase [Dentipellis sp. KUC8613]
MDFLLPSHFLNLPRPDPHDGRQEGVVDTTTLAAHDFDVDTRTGFMPPDPPLARLPERWEQWEALLDAAQREKLQLGKRAGLGEEDKARSERWRARIRELPTLGTAELNQSELLLRRAHHVLAWIMHFYIHSLPPDAEVRIPAPVSVPLLQVCVQLQLPPVLTYSDDVLYNWALANPDAAPDALPSLDNLRCLTLFTGTKDEEEFYLSSARIELRGVEALELMRASMDEIFVGDSIAITRLTRYLNALAPVIDDLTRLLLAVRDGCTPDVFYRDIRPWFNGADSNAQKWTFEGLDTHPELAQPSELSGPSAGQSSLVHALDIFLGVGEPAHPTGRYAADAHQLSFLARMQSYMPRHHRNFLRHLAAAPRPLRAAVEGGADAGLRAAYNAAVGALKRFRDAHMRIVALYIVGPARRFGNAAGGAENSGARDPAESQSEADREARSPLKGTGGTDLVRFLKGVRDQTAGAIMPAEAGAEAGPSRQ